MNGDGRATFPFEAVVGQDDAKLALRLAALDPLIGGVLLRGEKGSAKTTLARGLAALLGDAPFVELPLGATEDRLVGTLDVRAALTGGETQFEPGLLATADGGVLYVDEINLLPDHLVDVLLDVAVSGQNVVERDGVSHRHAARFVLVGSMNPEEGELRPQLLDRFGLCVEVHAPTDPSDRVAAVRRRLAFDGGDPSAGSTTDELEPPLDHADLPDAIVESATQLALAVGAEGLRADLTLCRAAVALARLDRHDAATASDLRRVAPLVLAHRSRRGPFDPPVVPPETIDDALDDVLPPPDAHDNESGPGQSTDPAPMALGAPRRPPLPEARHQPTTRGRAVADRPAGPSDSIAVVPSVRAIAARRRADSDAVASVDDLRTQVRVAPRRRSIILCVDLSGSMGATARAEAATGTVLGLLTDAYEGRSRVALVTFNGDGARTVLEPTSSIEVARHRIDDLATGGATPLADGLAEAGRIAARERNSDHDVVLAVLTDGRATDEDGVERAQDIGARLATEGYDSLVLDCESGPRPLGLAARLAEAMGARYLSVTDLAPIDVTSAVRAALGG